MFRKTISSLWLVFFLLPQLSSAQDLATQKQSTEISEGSIEIEGDSLETLLDRKMKAKGNAILKKGNKTIQAEVIEYDEVSEKIITTGNTNIDLESVNIVIKDDNNKIDVLRSLSDKDSIRINTSNISNDASIIITEGMDVYCSFESLKEVKNNILYKFKT